MSVSPNVYLTCLYFHCSSNARSIMSMTNLGCLDYSCMTYWTLCVKKLHVSCKKIPVEYGCKANSLHISCMGLPQIYRGRCNEDRGTNLRFPSV